MFPTRTHIEALRYIYADYHALYSPEEDDNPLETARMLAWMRDAIVEMEALLKHEETEEPKPSDVRDDTIPF